MVGQQTLTLLIGVRIPISQPYFFALARVTLLVKETLI